MKSNFTPDPRYMPAWPRLPWPEQHKWRYPFFIKVCEDLAKRLEVVWSHPSLSDSERGQIILAARNLSSVNSRMRIGDFDTFPARTTADFRRVETYVAMLEQKYTQTHNMEDGDVL